MGYNTPRDGELKLVEEKKDDGGCVHDDELEDRPVEEKRLSGAALLAAAGSNSNPADSNGDHDDPLAAEASGMHQDSEEMLQQQQIQLRQQDHQHQEGGKILNFSSPNVEQQAAANQVQADLAAQQLLQHALASQQQQQAQAQAQRTQLMTRSLNSLQLGIPAAVLPMTMNVMPPFAAAPQQLQSLTAAQIQQHVLAQQQAAAQAAALAIGAMTSSRTVAPSMGVPTAAALFAPGAPTAITPSALPTTQVHPQAAVAPLGMNPTAASPLLMAGVEDTTPAAPLLAANSMAATGATAALNPNANAAGVFPSGPLNNGVSTAVAMAAPHHLAPQMTIPHYVPPIPPTWGAQIPALTVQDRPLVPPVYNGINPNYPGAQLLHPHPPIFAVPNFLTPAECDFLIEAAQDALGPAPVVGKGSGEVSPSRTSSTCYLAREDLPEYLRKVSLLTGKPAEHCELPQVGRYMPSQQYLQHFDAFDLSNEDGRRFAANGGQRTVTVLVYLNDVPRGGATAFPNLNVEVRPRRGMALVFFPSTLDGLLDRMALHAALPAVDVKYVSQVWIRQSNYEGWPSKRLAGAMVAGLQERREAAALMGQLQQQHAAQQHTAHQQMNG